MLRTAKGVIKLEKHVIESIEKRLDAHGRELDNVEKCLERLTVISERMDKQENDHEKRLRALEGNSGAKWDKVVQTAISAVVGGVTAFALLQIGIG